MERLREDYVGAEFNEKIKREEERSKEGGGVEESWEAFKRGMEKVSGEVLGVKKVRRGKRKKTVWWNDEVKNAINMKNKKYREWMKMRTELSRMEYVHARNQAEEIKKKAKMNHGSE